MVTIWRHHPRLSNTWELDGSPINHISILTTYFLSAVCKYALCENQSHTHTHADTATHVIVMMMVVVRRHQLSTSASAMWLLQMCFSLNENIVSSQSNRCLSQLFNCQVSKVLDNSAVKKIHAVPIKVTFLTLEITESTFYCIHSEEGQDYEL